MFFESEQSAFVLGNLKDSTIRIVAGLQDKSNIRSVSLSFPRQNLNRIYLWNNLHKIITKKNSFNFRNTTNILNVEVWKYVCAWLRSNENDCMDTPVFSKAVVTLTFRG